MPVLYDDVAGNGSNLTSLNATQLTTGLVAAARGGVGADVSGVAKGGVIVGTGAGTFGLKAVGTDGQVLSADAASTGGVKWVAASTGTGDVSGPASSVDSEIALFSGTGGKTIKRATGSGLVQAASGVYSTIALPGGVTNFLREDGTFAAPSGTSSALVLLESHTASASATLDFTTAFTSTYDTYQIELVNVLPATNAANLTIRVSTNGGSTYDSAANYRWAAQFTNQTTFASASGSSTATSMFAGGTASSTAANGGICGSFRLANPLNASQHKLIVGEVAFFASDSQWYQFKIGGWYASITAVNAIRFLFDAGNITSGTIRIYGLTK